MLMYIIIILSTILSVIYPLVLIWGCIISWKNSFKEGLLFFIIMFIHRTILFIFDKTFFMYFPIITNFLLEVLAVLATAILIFGFYRHWKTK